MYTSITKEQLIHFVLNAVYEEERQQITKDTFQKAIDREKPIVFTDKSTSYVNIADYIEIHITEKLTEQTTKETLKWVHIAISNAKKILQGYHHSIGKDYLQSYLNEFCYKINRRYILELFNRVLKTCLIEHKKTKALFPVVI